MTSEVLSVANLEAVQAELERLHDRCEQGLVLIPEVSVLLASLDEKARAALPDGSDLFRLYDSRMRGTTDSWEHTLNGYVARSDCRNIGRRIAAIRQVLHEIEPEFLRAQVRTPTQIYFQAGEAYRARQEFYRLLRHASQGVDIVDRFMDAAVLDFIEPLDHGVRIRLLTDVPKSLFLRQLEGIRAAGRQLESRSNDRSHDRFVLLDSSEVWHLGASINHLGRRAFMMNRVSANDVQRVVSDFEDWWNTGTVL